MSDTSRVRNRVSSDHEDILNRTINREGPIMRDSQNIMRPPSDEDDAPGTTVGLSFWVCSTVVVFAVTLWVCNIHSTCPNASNAACGGDACFVGDHARLHLQKVTELGSRTAGSVSNEILAAGYLRNELDDITIIASQAGLEAEWDEHISNYSQLRTHLHVATYTNVRNFVLRLHDPHGITSDKSKAAFLVNCHYDSVVSSPGASDTFVNCAIMLEIARIIAKNRWSMVNDVVFLFNGAEENVLLGSHAFITQHRWAKNVRAFLNLEGAAAGGPLMVFQTGPNEAVSMLLDAYSKSFQQPFANVFGEVIFQSGLIPSDTDFRVFRDYGRIPGLDMAYIADGYAYHTSFDTESRVPQNCLHQNGNDLTRFLKLIANDQRLSSVREMHPIDSNATSSLKLNELASNNVPLSVRPVPKIATKVANRRVYFDFLGLTFILVSWKVWKLFNWILILSTVTWVVAGRHGRLFGLSSAIVLQILSHVLGFGFSYLVGTLTHHFGTRMSWFSFRYYVVGVFLFPILWWFSWFFTRLFRIPDGLAFRCWPITKLCSTTKWVVNHKTSYTAIECDFFEASLLFLVIPASILALMNNPFVFVYNLWLVTLLVWRILCRSVLARLYANNPTVFVLTLVPLLSWYANTCCILLNVVIPIMGRAGDAVKPDVLVSLCIFAMLIPITLVFNVFLLSTSNRTGKLLRTVLLNICISYAVLAHFTPLGFPYSASSVPKLFDPFVSPRYQRVMLFHTDRSFRSTPGDSAVTSTDSFVTVRPMDVNGDRYLRQNSYPQFPLSSVLSKLFTDSNNAGDHPTDDLLDSIRTTACNHSLPYCGSTLIHPLAHMFSKFYHIPVEPHGASPKVSLKLVSHNKLADGASVASDRVAYNLTFSVSSGPPTMNLLIRTAVPHIRLSNWSFPMDAAHPVPMPLPHFTADEDAHDSGAHYVITHLNPSLVGGTKHSSATTMGDWTFWLVFDQRPEDVEQFNHVDVAVAGLYLDDRLPSSSSVSIEAVRARLPPWTVVSSACTTYDHWRFNLTLL